MFGVLASLLLIKDVNHQILTLINNVVMITLRIGVTTITQVA